MIADLIAVTFEDVTKIIECKPIGEKVNLIEDEEPPDEIKVPPRMTGKAMDVFLNFYLEEISHIDEEHMQFRIDYYLLQVG